MSLSAADSAKRAAALLALDLVQDGMLLGLGSGSTSDWFVRVLGERIGAGDLRVTAVATSAATARLATELGVPLRGPEEVSVLDLVVDGADEFDPQLNLIKGGGAQLLQEKIIAAAGRRLVIVADENKRVPRLGAYPLPVEVVRFGWTLTRARIEAALVRLGFDARAVRPRKTGDEILVTEQGHLILDLDLHSIPDVPALAAALDGLPGVVEHGLFVGMTDCVALGHADGSAAFLRRIDPALSGPLDALDEMRDEDA